MTWAVVTYAGMLILGLAARVLYPGLPDPEVAFVYATTHLFPPLVAGIMVAAVLSAIMSTADSQLLVAASRAPYGRINQLDNRLASGDETIRPRLDAHAARHFSQVSADIFRRTLEVRGCGHGVRVTTPLGFYPRRVDPSRIVADDQVGNFAANAVIAVAVSLGNLLQIFEHR